MTKYRLEILGDNDGWHYCGIYKTPEAAWRRAQVLIERGQTQRLYKNQQFRVFKQDVDGGYGTMTQVRFRQSHAEGGVIIAALVNGAKEGAWLE
jgi:hypothetical protein